MANLFRQQGASGRLHNAIYEPGYFGALPKAYKTTTEPVLIPVTFIIGCMDLYGYCVSGSICVTLHPCKVSQTCIIQK